MKRMCVALVGIAGLSIFGCRRAPSKIHVEHAMANVVPTGSGAAYFEVVNDGDGADRLLSVASPVVASVQLHEMVHDGDLTSMRAVKEIDVPAHSTVRLERGGKHVMLFGMNATAAGPERTKIPLVLHFERTGDVAIEAPVEPLFGAMEQAGKRQLRVCADPNNLPFSNEKGEGFENELASLIANELHADLAYTWAPQRRGFVRTTLKAKRCDVVMGVPKQLDMLRTTNPYYRSSYVFVTRPGTASPASLDDPALHELRIGVPAVGDDGANPPVALALTRHGLVENLRGYSVFGDYREESPPADLIRALRKREVDVALAWGPLAGWYATHPEPKLTVAPVPEKDAPPGMSFAFDIAMGVRKDDAVLARELDDVLLRKKSDIDALLDRYGVPRI